MPGLCKIGMTTVSPEIRAEQLSRETGIPTPFVVVWSEEVTDCTIAERRIHERLSDYRLSNRREFFKVDAKTAITIIQDVCKELR
jgi:hypothetical protein